MNEWLAERVLLAVEQIPPGRVAAYGDIAAIVGTGPRLVGAVLSRHGAAVPWWRVTNASGAFAGSLVQRAQPHWAEEGILVRPDGRGCRINHYRADQEALGQAYAAAVADLLAEHGTPLPRVSGPAGRALAAAGITALEQLTEWTSADLGALHGLGPNGITVVAAALKAQGWSFRAPSPDR